MKRYLLLLAVFAAGQAVAAPRQAAAPSDSIEIDAQELPHAFPHYWEQMFGSGRAILSLRESYRKDLRTVNQATGFKYVRFHAIFHDEVGLYSEKAGQPDYNFSYVDQIYDGLLANGIRPFVELSFMPRQLAAQPLQQPFWYHPYNGPPKDWDKWGNMIEAFTKHLVDRYGLDEVASWYFEVWNEPNIDFWAGDPKEATYYQLYDVSVRAIKRVSPQLRVGGPSTAQAAWVDRFIRHCTTENVPVDFVSTHVYGNDSSRDVFGTDEKIGRDAMVIRAVKKVHDQIKASPKPDLPLIFSEYNASYMNEVEVTDSAFMGPWLAHTVAECAGLVDIMSYWSFSDVFEEQGVVKKPFYGGYGLMAAGSIPKPALNDFRLLHELGDQRLPVKSDSALATRSEDGRLEVAVWNYAPPGAEGAARQIELTFKGLGKARQVKLQIVDDDHGSSLKAWKAMGSPAFPSRAQQQQLIEAGALPAAENRSLPKGDAPTLTLNLAPHALALVVVSR